MIALLIGDAGHRLRLGVEPAMPERELQQAEEAVGVVGFLLGVFVEHLATHPGFDAEGFELPVEQAVVQIIP